MDDVLQIIGLVLVCLGLGFWSIPAGIVAAGLACILLSLALAGGESKGVRRWRS